MALAGPKEGLRAPLFFSFYWLVLGDPACAQSVSQQDLQRCAALPSNELKLACFEALAGAPANVPAAPTPVPAAPVSDASAPSPQAAPAAAPKANATDDTAATATAPAEAAGSAVLAVAEQPAADMAGREPRPASAGGSTSPPQGEAQAVSMAASADSATTAGYSGDSDDQQPEEQVLPADGDLVLTVDKVVRDKRRRLVFYFDNGQVWRQRIDDYLSYPKNEPFEVEISRGMMGDYRLRVGGEGRMSRIERIE